MRFARFLLAAVVWTAGVAVLSTPIEAEDGGCTTATSAEVRELYDRYAHALHRGDVEALTALYSPDAILMGPAATSIRLGHGEIAGYYSAFLARRPKVTVVERVVRTECGSLGDSGAEAVTLPSIEATSAHSATSRYSMSYARFGAQWLIVHHRQDLPDDLRAEFLAADGAPSAIVTGANPPLSQWLELPPVPFALPTSPPVILSATRPLMPLVEVVTPIDFAALDHLLAIVPKIPKAASVPLGPPASAVPTVDRSMVDTPTHDKHLPARKAVEVVVLPPVIVLAPSPPLGDAGREQPVAPVAQQLPETQKAESVPKAPDDVPLAAAVMVPAVAGFTQRISPPAIPATPPQAEAVSAPKSTPLPPAVTSPSNSAAPAKSAPAAAILKPARPEPRPDTKQGAPARTSPARAESAPARAASPPRPAKEPPPAKSGKFLRWEDGTPIFDD